MLVKQSCIIWDVEGGIGGNSPSKGSDVDPRLQQGGKGVCASVPITLSRIIVRSVLSLSVQVRVRAGAASPIPIFLVCSSSLLSPRARMGQRFFFGQEKLKTNQRRQMKLK